MSCFESLKIDLSQYKEALMDRVLHVVTVIEY